MKKILQFTALYIASFTTMGALPAWGHNSVFLNDKPQVVISDLDKLQAVGAFLLSRDESTNLGVAQLTPVQMNRISNATHFQGKCAGFEVLNSEETSASGRVLQDLITITRKLVAVSPIKLPDVQFNQNYKDLATAANPQGLLSEIQWISNYPTRFNRAPQPNAHVEELKTRLETLLADAAWPYSITLIDHMSTKQKSLRLTIEGRLRPKEIVVLGAHFDSINQSYFGSTLAPGADDNASGAANLIETVKILMNAPQPERSLEFFWYAGEESGLLGSSEIAKDYKAKNKSVIAVLQLDMTLHPGNGEQIIGLLSDYTSPWLNEVFSKIYSLYLDASFVSDTCGYGCSDHASWTRQGFPAAAPFEATTRTMNRLIHSENDRINSESSLTHSNTFTKLATLFALTLGNSNLKQN